MASERLQRQIARLLDEAELAIAQRDWATVRERAQDVVSIDPENSEGQAFLDAADRASATDVAPPQSATQSRTSTSTPTTIPIPSADPSSFANGRYQVKRSLGEGGKKVVYLAHDGILDRDVALAVIPSGCDC